MAGRHCHLRQGGHGAVIKLLLESGKVDVNSTDKNGQTPLSYAAKEGHNTVVKLLQPPPMSGLLASQRPLWQLAHA
jgi:ankyrin repeat protein